MSRHSTDTRTSSKTVTDIKNIPARRLYRGVLEYARRLENGRQHRRNLMSVFQSEQVGLRHKLRDACEKLMFSHPIEYGRKAEELIWRKVYYEVIQLVKSNKKFMKSGSRLELLYKEYLSAAIGYYHHLLLKLQAKYQPHIAVDWPFASSPLSDKYKRRREVTILSAKQVNEPSTDKDVSKIKKVKSHTILSKKSKNADRDAPEKVMTIDEWAQETSYRILLCLGDLGRYLVEHGGSRSFAERFYQLALLVKPNIGMPFNQLGTLAGHHTWWGLTAAYYYYRCLEAENRFDGADGNLQKLLDRNKKNFYQIPTDALENMISSEEYRKEHTRIFIISFLYLCDLLRPKTYATDVEITGLCKKLIDALPVCLSHSSHLQDEKTSGHSNNKRENGKSKWDVAGLVHHHHHHHNGDFTFLQQHIILKMCTLCIINIHSLQSSRSNRLSAAIAFALAFFSHLLGHVISSLIPDEPKPETNDTVNSILQDEEEEEQIQSKTETGDGDAPRAKSSVNNKRKKSRMMRRRRHRGSGDSDLSEGDLYSGSDVSDSENDSNDSDSSSTTSTNSELSQEGMDEIILNNSKSGNENKKSDNDKTKSDEATKNMAIVDNHAGLELANSLANGPSTLASLKDISQKMFQPTSRRRILLAPSFFNNVNKPIPADDKVVNGDNKGSGDEKKQVKTEDENVVKQEEQNQDKIIEKQNSEGDKDDNQLISDEKSENIPTDETDIEKQNGDHPLYDNATMSQKIFETAGSLHQLFASVKLLCDWLDANEKVTAACAQNSKALWSRIAKLASMLPNEEEMIKIDEVQSDEMLQSQLTIAKSCATSAKKWKQKSKLPEDYILSQTTSSVRYADDKNKKVESLICDLTDIQQVVIRLCRIRSFCHSLSSVEGLGMKYDEITGKFKGPDEPSEDDAEHLDIETVEEMRKTRLMKDMAELRLRNEVNALESQLGTPRTQDAGLCLYLVPDALALCHDLGHLRKLLSFERYFIVIPKTVIDGLDGLKKDLQGARDAIRFLETEFKKGNRFIKAQMAEETSRGVQGERPKLRRNDMQAWRFYRIIECCRYITQQKAKEDNSDTNGLVAILTHSTDKSTLSQNQINAISAAEGFGIQVFSAMQFAQLAKKLPPQSK
ncbi:nonsense-mediated mRNA decay factor SMG5-like [Styela clava]